MILVFLNLITCVPHNLTPHDFILEKYPRSGKIFFSSTIWKQPRFSSLIRYKVMNITRQSWKQRRYHSCPFSNFQIIVNIIESTVWAHWQHYEIYHQSTKFHHTLTKTTALGCPKLVWKKSLTLTRFFVSKKSLRTMLIRTLRLRFAWNLRTL